MSRKQLVLLTIICGWVVIAFLVASYHSMDPNPVWLVQKQEELRGKESLKFTYEALYKEVKKNPDGTYTGPWELLVGIPAGEPSLEKVTAEIKTLKKEIEAGSKRRVRWAFHFSSNQQSEWGPDHEDISKLLVLLIPALIISVPLWFWVGRRVETENGNGETVISERREP